MLVNKHLPNEAHSCCLIGETPGHGLGELSEHWIFAPSSPTITGRQNNPWSGSLGFSQDQNLSENGCFEEKAKGLLMKPELRATMKVLLVTSTLAAPGTAWGT